jgi:ribokinase
VRVICAGHVNWDVTLKVDGLPDPDGEARILEHHRSGGGSAANAASVLATLEVPSAILGSVGTDQHGVQARRELVDAGVDATHLVETGVGTATKYLVVDPDGRVMVLGRDRGNEAFHADDVPRETVRAADHLHLTSQRPATAAELATVAGGAGVPVSVDPGRLVGKRGFDEVLDRADYLFLTDAEARTVGIDPDDADDRPSDGVAVVKYGAGGAEVRTPERTVRHDGYEVDPVDTTGAGDAFAGGFVTALLGGWDPRPDGGSGGGDGGGGDGAGGGDVGSRGDASRGGGDGGGEGDGAADGRGTVGVPDYDRVLAIANACGALAARRTGARAHISRVDVERFLRGRV